LNDFAFRSFGSEETTSISPRDCSIAEAARGHRLPGWRSLAGVMLVETFELTGFRALLTLWLRNGWH
jgi:hypothetical protein